MFFIFIKYRFFKWPYLDKYEDLEGRTGTDRHLFSCPIVLDRFWAPLLSADAGVYIYILLFIDLFIYLL